jgi:RNA polymerase sigma factor (sigma-70 family)
MIRRSRTATSRRRPAATASAVRWGSVETRPMGPSAKERFDALFSSHAPRVLAYALRRTRSVADAEDAVAETFLVAWRRLGDVPAGSDSVLWLYGVCRRVLANQRRAGDRLSRLLDRLRHQEPRAVGPDRDEPGPAMAALATLGEDDRELLRLVAWEELSHGQIATVLGITPNAVAIRLHRARKRFAEALGRPAGNRVKGSGGNRTRTG